MSTNKKNKLSILDKVAIRIQYYEKEMIGVFIITAILFGLGFYFEKTSAFAVGVATFCYFMYQFFQGINSDVMANKMESLLAQEANVAPESNAYYDDDEFNSGNMKHSKETFDPQYAYLPQNSFHGSSFDVSKIDH